MHDDSDTVADSVVLVARTAGLEWPDKDKTSVAATLEVVVTPVNDAVPRLVNNTGLTVWAGSSVALTNAMLGAEDGDTAAANLTFSISSPHCGMVSLASRPAYPVSKFTQLQLASSQVMFTHTGTIYKSININNSGSHCDGLLKCCCLHVARELHSAVTRQYSVFTLLLTRALQL